MIYSDKLIILKALLHVVLKCVQSNNKLLPICILYSIDRRALKSNYFSPFTLRNNDVHIASLECMEDVMYGR